MGKFDGVLICTDLDGTLYRHDKTISRENKEAIDFFKREGGLFTFITGRLPYYSTDAHNAVEPNIAYGCCNGAGLYDGEKNEYIWTCERSTLAMELIQTVDERLPSVGIQVCGFEHTYFSKYNEAMRRFRELAKLPNLVCGYRDVAEPFGKIIFASDSDDEIIEIEKTLRDHPLSSNFEFVRSERTLFEILPKGVNKGLALTKLVEHMNLDIKKSFAIGDYDNDIGMFRAARFGIAVANASKKARDAADYVTVSNEEHAIARVICDIESGKYIF